GSQVEVFQRAIGLGRGARLDEVMRDLRWTLVTGSFVGALDRVRDGEVQSLAPQERQSGQQRLPDQLVRERVVDLAVARLRHDDSSGLGLLDDVEQGTRVDVR